MLVQRSDLSLYWSTLAAVCYGAALWQCVVVCHKSAVVGDYVTLEPRHAHNW